MCEFLLQNLKYPDNQLSILMQVVKVSLININPLYINLIMLHNS
jgi:hypothetical protein